MFKLFKTLCVPKVQNMMWRCPKPTALDRAQRQISLSPSNHRLYTQGTSTNGGNTMNSLASRNLQMLAFCNPWNPGENPPKKDETPHINPSNAAPISTVLDQSALCSQLTHKTSSNQENLSTKTISKCKENQYLRDRTLNSKQTTFRKEKVKDIMADNIVPGTRTNITQSNLVLNDNRIVSPFDCVCGDQQSLDATLESSCLQVLTKVLELDRSRFLGTNLLSCVCPGGSNEKTPEKNIDCKPKQLEIFPAYRKCPPVKSNPMWANIFPPRCPKRESAKANLSASVVPNSGSTKFESLCVTKPPPINKPPCESKLPKCESPCPPEPPCPPCPPPVQDCLPPCPPPCQGQCVNLQSNSQPCSCEAPNFPMPFKPPTYPMVCPPPVDHFVSFEGNQCKACPPAVDKWAEITAKMGSKASEVKPMPPCAPPSPPPTSTCPPFCCNPYAFTYYPCCPCQPCQCFCPRCCACPGCPCPSPCLPGALPPLPGPPKPPESPPCCCPCCCPEPAMPCKPPMPKEKPIMGNKLTPCVKPPCCCPECCPPPAESCKPPMPEQKPIGGNKVKPCGLCQCCLNPYCRYLYMNSQCCYPWYPPRCDAWRCHSPRSVNTCYPCCAMRANNFNKDLFNNWL